MRTNVFVVGLDEFNLETLRGLREFDRYDVHPLLPTGDVVKAVSYDYDELVEAADRELAEFDGPVDAVVTWWDFPSSGLVPLLGELYDVQGPSLRSVLRLEHKYWSRVTQRAVAPDHVPPFATFQPEDEAALETIQDQGVQLPFWIKPIKSVASYLGFKIEDEQDLEDALAVIREEIGQFGDPFEQALDQVDLPTDIAQLGGRACIAEGLIGGQQCTLEGYVHEGEVTVYGTVDTLTEGDRSTIRAYRYPSTLPPTVRDRMIDVAGKVVRQAGLDNSCFNAEFFHDPDTDTIWLLEINTRLSNSHCDLFAKVDGASSQRALLDVHTGRAPRMPTGRGPFAVAGKCFLRAYEDGVVQSVPGDEQLEELARRFPGTRVELDVQPGDRLSEALLVQESYSYELGRVWVGADDDEELDRRFEDVRKLLAIEVA